MKTIKDAVIELKGKLPNENEQGCFRAACAAIYYVEGGNGIRLGSFEEFEAEAKRMGYINGYEWGKEYPTNGKRPELPDGVEVIRSDSRLAGCFGGAVRVSMDMDWAFTVSFKITDQRYKPVDEVSDNASSQDQSLTHNEERLTHSEWHERGELPPVGVECEVYFDTDHSPEWHRGTVTYRSDKFTVIIYADGDERCYEPEELDGAKFRPIRTEREKVIDAAMKFCYDKNSVEEMIESIYDAGMLVLPPKKSDTKD